MNNLKNRIDFMSLISVEHANPNGSPTGDGNMPRLAYDGRGMISAVCIGRKIRNRAQMMGQKIMMVADRMNEDGYTSLAARVEDIRKNAENRDKLWALITQKYWDARAKGYVLAYSVEENGKKVSVSEHLTGPLTICDAYSVAPVELEDVQITKSFNGSMVTEKDKSGMTSDRMGHQYKVAHGLYLVKGSLNPYLAEKSGFTEEDAEVVKAALASLFENDESAARPAGSMNVEAVYWCKSAGKTGNLSTAAVHRLLSVTAKKEQPRSMDDYECSFDAKTAKAKGIEVDFFDPSEGWKNL